MLTKSFSAWFAVLCCLAAFLAPSVRLRAQERQNVVAAGTLKAGAVLPLTGPAAFAGVGIQQGMQLALAEIGAHEIRVVYEDSRLDRLAAVNAVRRLLEVEKAEIVLVDVVNTVTALSPILERSKVPGIVVWDSNHTIADLSRYIFGFGYSTEMAAADMAKHAIENLKLTKLAVISAHDEWSEVISKAFVKELRELGGEVILHEIVTLETGDFRALINRARRLKAQGIYAPLYGLNLSSFIKQARQSNFPGYILSADGFSQNEIDQLGAAATEGIWLTQVWSEDAGFVEKYRQKYGPGSGINVGFAALGYDVIYYLRELRNALLKAGKPLTPNHLYSQILAADYQGLSGRTDYSQSRLTSKRQLLLTVRGGKITAP